LKFPFFEAVNDFSTTWSFIPYPLQGIFAAVIYTSAVLPLANYRSSVLAVRKDSSIKGTCFFGFLWTFFLLET
jgi:hypothetical protein